MRRMTREGHYVLTHHALDEMIADDLSTSTEYFIRRNYVKLLFMKVFCFRFFPISYK